MAHLKRLRAPKSWPLLQRKGIKFIARPMPGPHSFENCITINIILKDILNYAKTTKDSKRILNQGSFLINNKVRMSHKFTVGILDTVSLKTLDEYYRVVYDKNGRLSLIKIRKEETEDKLVKIKNKKTLKKNKTQLNFLDGTNLLINKGNYKSRDSLILKGNKIQKHLKFEKGALAYLTGGKYKGMSGIIDEIEESSAITKGKISLKVGKEKITTKKDFAFIIEKPFTK